MKVTNNCLLNTVYLVFLSKIFLFFLSNGKFYMKTMSNNETCEFSLIYHHALCPLCLKKQRISMHNLLGKGTIFVPCFLQSRCSDHPLDAMVHLSHTGAFSILHSYRYLLIFQSKVASSLCSTVMTSCMIFSVLNKVCIKLFSKIFSFEVNNGNKYLSIYS